MSETLSTETRPSTLQLLELGMLHLSDLQRARVAELREVASSLGVEQAPQLKKNELVFHILEEYVGKRGIMFGEGVVEVLPDGFGFLRSPDYCYLPSPDDIYLAAPLVQQHQLETGHVVSGQIRPPQAKERHFSLARVDQIQGESPSEREAVPPFDDLTPLHPDRLLRLEVEGGPPAMRLIDVLAPIGFGQRGLIVAPPRAGKTVLLQQIANAVRANHPDAVLMMLLIDERPEEVTEMERQVDGEIIASTFDEPAGRHVQVSEIALEKAKHLVSFGHDVVLLLDSITRLGRAYNSEAPHSGRVLTGGVDANALQEPKRIFGAARNVEQGGSLTILATALIETGSRMDEVIFEEFKGTGNMELVLDRGLAEARIYPAIHPGKSGTRMEDALLSEQEQALARRLRQLIARMRPEAAMELLLPKFAGSSSNQELLQKLETAGGLE